MGVIAILLVGLLVATLQIVVEGVRRREHLRIYTLAALAAFFGGSLVKAIAQESLGAFSFGSVAVAGATAGMILYAWRQLALKPEPARRQVPSGR